MLKIRRIESGDGSLLRSLSKEIGSGPGDLYCYTPEDLSQMTLKEWNIRARWLAGSSDSAGFITFEDERPCGLVTGRVGYFVSGALHYEMEEYCTLSRFWAERGSEDRAASHELLEAIAGWAEMRGAGCLEAGITEAGRETAEILIREGFADTGRRENLPGDERIEISFLSRELRGGLK